MSDGLISSVAPPMVADRCCSHRSGGATHSICGRLRVIPPSGALIIAQRSLGSNGIDEFRAFLQCHTVSPARYRTVREVCGEITGMTSDSQ